MRCARAAAVDCSQVGTPVSPRNVIITYYNNALEFNTGFIRTKHSGMFWHENSRENCEICKKKTDDNFNYELDMSSNYRYANELASAMR